MVMENPATMPHYLTLYFPIKPALKDGNRNLNGDYYKKPTNYWFVNCKSEDNFVTEPLTWVEALEISKVKSGELSRQTKRSLMHPQYARRFIMQHLLNEETLNEALESKGVKNASSFPYREDMGTLL